MHQQISKKIITYLFILLVLGTFSNKKILQLNLRENYNFNIVNLSEFNEDNIIQDLYKLENQNLFLLKKERVLKVIDTHKIIEKFFVFKNYPSNLNIKIERTEFLAVTKKKWVQFLYWFKWKINSY